jgi:hypothetical protein
VGSSRPLRASMTANGVMIMIRMHSKGKINLTE